MSMTPASALAFFASVIKSGEPWTSACQQAMDEALAHVYHLTQPAQSVDVEKVREVIAELLCRGNTGFNTNDRARCNHWADKLTAAATVGEALDKLAGTGTVPMPRALTAENGAKAALMGEFEQLREVTCHECDGTGMTGDSVGSCMACDGSGTLYETITIEWTTIKAIYRAAVRHFHPEAP